MVGERWQGPNLETKIASQKNSSVARNIAHCKLKKFLGFVKRFSKFARGIYETCDRNFFNLALTFVVVAFSIVKFIFKFC